MADLRYDPIANLWVAIARNRGDRPMEFILLEQARQQLICPFCRGNEDQTPSHLAAYGPNGELLQPTGELLQPTDDRSDWVVRVVPNKYPSFIGPHTAGQEVGPYGMTSSDGVQELIIPSSRHVSSTSELTETELNISFLAYQDRIGQLRSLTGIEHAMLFKNCRFAAGASLGHIHTQLIGAPIVTGHVQGRLERNRRHREQQGCSIMSSLLEWEQQSSKRLIEQTEHFVAFCPYASRFAFQIWIAPIQGQLPFDQCPASVCQDLARLCQELIKRLESLLDKPAYNLLFQMAPLADSHDDHWYVELFPRLTQAAGFEWGTDCWINPVPPETAAKQMR